MEIRGYHKPIEDGWKNGLETGLTMADANGDGWFDLYVCYSGNAPGEGFNKPVIVDHPKRANQLFINQGCRPGDVPVFLEQAAESGIDANISILRFKDAPTKIIASRNNDRASIYEITKYPGTSIKKNNSKT
jgi:hypothetical protein